MLSLALSLLLLSSICPTNSQFSPCHKNDAATLLDIKRSFGDPPSLASWNESADCCSWPGVRCDYDNGRVTDVSLDSSDISGLISPSIGQLSALKILSISGTGIFGAIPTSIGKLTSLTFLSFNNNSRLTGTIPRQLCSLQNLEDLDLGDNNLCGSIPDCFGTKLAMINLSGNKLSGPIPDNFMSGVKTVVPSPRLFLARNRLTGPIPRSLGDVPLKFIDFSDNRLTGDASFLFREKGSLEDVYLARNKLEFDLSKVEFPLRMEVLDLSHNKIYGSIPRQISKLGMLNMLNLRYNKLCGPIPTAGFMKNFDAFSFEHNKCLCGGPLPPCH